MRPWGRYAYVAALCAGLGGLQGVAGIEQIGRGFRPLTHAPGRVPYSWDMFAIRIDRCALSWEPPLRVEGRPVSRWRDRSWALEFDSVFDDAGSYRAVARYACRYRAARRTLARAVCVTGDGAIEESTVACP